MHYTYDMKKCMYILYMYTYCEYFCCNIFQGAESCVGIFMYIDISVHMHVYVFERLNIDIYS